MTLKKTNVLLCLCIGLFGCENNIETSDNNPCLLDKGVNVVYDLDLPLYADLGFSGNSDFIRDEINFIKGVYIQNLGGLFTVIELAEPNDCSQVCDVPTSLTDGYFVYDCNGEERSYDISGKKVDGDSNDFDMRKYFTNYNETNNTLTISY